MTIQIGLMMNHPGLKFCIIFLKRQTPNTRTWPDKTMAREVGFTEIDGLRIGGGLLRGVLTAKKINITKKEFTDADAMKSVSDSFRLVRLGIFSEIGLRRFALCFQSCNAGGYQPFWKYIGHDPHANHLTTQCHEVHYTPSTLNSLNSKLRAVSLRWLNESNHCDEWHSSSHITYAIYIPAIISFDFSFTREKKICEFLKAWLT